MTSRSRPFVAAAGAALLALSAFPFMASAAGAPTPVRAVSALVQPFTHPSAPSNPAACNALTGHLAACPLTQRLRSAVQRNDHWQRTHPGGGGNAFCRCQNPPRSIGVTLMNQKNGVAYVSTRWNYGDSTYLSLIWVVVRRHGAWLVDDSYCAGKPSTSMYHVPIGPCS